MLQMPGWIGRCCGCQDRYADAGGTNTPARVCLRAGLLPLPLSHEHTCVCPHMQAPHAGKHQSTKWQAGSFPTNYCTVLYCAVLHSTVMCCTALYCTRGTCSSLQKRTGTRLLARSLAAAASAQFHQSGGAAATDSTRLKPVLMLAV